MKKQYTQPSLKLIKLLTKDIICGSDSDIEVDAGGSGLFD